MYVLGDILSAVLLLLPRRCRATCSSPPPSGASSTSTWPPSCSARWGGRRATGAGTEQPRVPHSLVPRFSTGGLNPSVRSLKAETAHCIPVCATPQPLRSLPRLSHPRAVARLLLRPPTAPPRPRETPCCGSGASPCCRVRRGGGVGERAGEARTREVHIGGPAGGRGRQEPWRTPWGGGEGGSGGVRSACKRRPCCTHLAGNRWYGSTGTSP